MEPDRQVSSLDNSFQQGKQLAALGKLPEAVQILERVCGQAPTPDRWLALAACYFRQTRNDDCREALRKALALDPEHGPTRKFLKRVTGSEAIPAASKGRGAIHVEERPPSPRESPPSQETSGTGCLGVVAAAFLGLLGILLGH
jgi:tetratricopeptide (TPR) repeat protein